MLAPKPRPTAWTLQHVEINCPSAMLVTESLLYAHLTLPRKAWVFFKLPLSIPKIAALQRDLLSAQNSAPRGPITIEGDF